MDSSSLAAALPMGFCECGTEFLVAEWIQVA
jgi:hypothetical protein